MLKHTILGFVTLAVALAAMPDAKGQELPELLLKHRDALGGEAALKKIRTMDRSWDFQMLFIQGSLVEKSAAPDKYYTKLSTPVITQVQGENGRTAGQSSLSTFFPNFFRKPLLLKATTPPWRNPWIPSGR